MDETYVKVKEQWMYQYRAVDKDGDLVAPSANTLLKKQPFLKSATEPCRLVVWMLLNLFNKFALI